MRAVQLGESAVRLTGETTQEVQALLQIWLDDESIQSFQIGERWFIFADGTLGGCVVKTFWNLPDESLHFYATMELFCPGYQEPTGFRPEADGYAMSPNDTPFVIVR